MSAAMMARVWAQTKHSGARLSLLLALADLADDDGKSYVAASSLATKCRMELRAVRRVLDALLESGELAIEGIERPRGRNQYRILLGSAR